MRLFMELYPLMAGLLAAVAVIYTATMGHAQTEALLWAALTGGLLAVPATACVARTRG